MTIKHFTNRNIYLLIALPILLLIILDEVVFIKKNNLMQESERVNKVFEKKEKILKNLLDTVTLRLRGNPEVLSDWSLLRFFVETEDDFGVSVSNTNRLLFWSSSLITVQSDGSILNKTSGLIHLPTGWYYQVSRIEGEYLINGFFLIKREFPYHNRFISSFFSRDFMIPDNYNVLTSPQANALNLFRSNGTHILSIKVPDDFIRISRCSVFSALLYFMLLFCALAQLNVFLKRNKRLTAPLKFFLSFVISIVIYLIFNELKLPTSLYQSNLFSPKDFAFSGWLSSLGEYILLAVLMFNCSYTFFFFSVYDRYQSFSKYFKIFSFLFVAFYFSISVALCKILLLNSNITLEFFSDLKFSAVNLFAFFSLSLHLIGFIIILLRLRLDYLKEMGFYGFVFALFVSGFISGVTISYFCFQIELIPFSYYAIVVLVIARFEINRIIEFKFTFLLIMSIFGAAYVNLYSQGLILEKKSKVLDLQAVKLSSERDPGAEIFLSELDSKLRKDTLIKYHLLPPYKSLESYFLNNYFTGFWRNYNMQITVCLPEDKVLITDENKDYPCFGFFNNLKKTMGMIVTGSNFYFMDRLNGRISYLGQLDLVNSINLPVHVFIELNSKVIPEGKGYPELLLDEHASRVSLDGGFSYAKYFDGKLVDRGGAYQYSINLPVDIVPKEEYTHYSINGYRHCAYNRNGNNFVICSYPEMGFFERINTFPNLFLLFYLIGTIVLIFNENSFRIRSNNLDLREKIQLTLILSLLSILTIIGIGLMFYNSNKLLKSFQDNLSEKLNSVSAELSNRIGMESELNAPMREFLNDQLIVLSDIIRTDINIYDINGRLFATSRSEIYDRGLLSRRINPFAFKEISYDRKSLFLHDESLGEMNFLSAYSPFYNQNNQLIGYLNLPYFTRQDDFKKQVSTFIVTFSNLFIFLIMFSLIVAMIISHNLTAPLLQIENNLKRIQLGKANAKIEYSGEDEIGRLVKEYNKKVDELAESAELLARSERESAWKEMARQVAHEINNPLTPMKLSIQYLQKIKEKNSEHFDEYFNRVSRTLVEQFDALSLIASSFSDFALMPRVHDEIVDLVQKIKEVVILFENTNNVLVSFSSLNESSIIVLADRDQLSRALINLIKNGIQAIPRNRKGILKVESYRDLEYAYISVNDNGSGISPELHDKLFEPSFTTKSSGMGLGLAITKKIIENFKGEIWFQSNQEEGTTFFIKLPLYHSV